MYKQLNMSRRYAGFGNAFLIIVLLFSTVGLDPTPVSAAPAGTALQFNGTSQYVTLGRAAPSQGTLTPTTTPPAWQTLPANIKFGSSSLAFNGSQYVTIGTAPDLGAQNFTIETWFMKTGAGTTTSTGGGGLTAAIPLVTKGRA